MSAVHGGRRFSRSCEFCFKPMLSHKDMSNTVCLACDKQLEKEWNEAEGARSLAHANKYKCTTCGCGLSLDRRFQCVTCLPDHARELADEWDSFDSTDADSPELNINTAKIRIASRPIDSKLCTKCKQVKDVSEFGLSAASRSGYNWRCKSCVNENNRGWTEQRKKAKESTNELS